MSRVEVNVVTAEQATHNEMVQEQNDQMFFGRVADIIDTQLVDEDWLEVYRADAVIFIDCH